jgi:hypothetical protein
VGRYFLTTPPGSILPGMSPDRNHSRRPSAGAAGVIEGAQATLEETYDPTEEF